MQLEKLALSLRHRNPWQAADLGFRVTQHWYPRLWLIWGLPAFLLYGISAFILPLDRMVYVPLFIWWLKPVFDATVIVFLSRAIFGEQMSLWQTWRSTPRMLGGAIFAWLTWRRLSMTRSIDLPVSLLEHLGGSARKKRLQTLHIGWGVAGGRLTITCVHLELILLLGMITMLVLIESSNLKDTFLFFIVGDDSAIAIHGYGLLYLLTISCVGPFYAATGFILYIMRRVELEGWDIEIRFRALASRLPSRQTILAAVLATSLCIFAPWSIPKAHASPSPSGVEAERQQASEQVQKIIDDLHFTQKIPLSQPKETRKSSSDFSLSPVILDIVRIVLIVVLIAAILIALRKADILHFKIPERKRPPPVEMMFGMDVRPEAIPQNVTDQVWAYWQAGNKRAALALLYRASLSRLLSEKNVPFAAYHTEEDCIRLTRLHAPEISDVFGHVTRMWQSLAWGHHLPEDHAMKMLCNQWEARFGHAA